METSASKEAMLAERNLIKKVQQMNSMFKELKHACQYNRKKGNQAVLESTRSRRHKRRIYRAQRAFQESGTSTAYMRIKWEGKSINTDP